MRRQREEARAMGLVPWPRLSQSRLPWWMTRSWLGGGRDGGRAGEARDGDSTLSEQGTSTGREERPLSAGRGGASASIGRGHWQRGHPHVSAYPRPRPKVQKAGSNSSTLRVWRRIRSALQVGVSRLLARRRQWDVRITMPAALTNLHPLNPRANPPCTHGRHRKRNRGDHGSSVDLPTSSIPLPPAVGPSVASRVTPPLTETSKTALAPIPATPINQGPEWGDFLPRSFSTR